MRKYYVYVFLRKDRYTPYYVGKGKGQRCYSNSRVIPRPADKSRIVKVKEGLTEEESFELENLLIKFWGRKDLGTGILHNMTDGGDGNSGWNPPPEWRENRSNYMKENNPFKGQRHTQETRERMSKMKKGKIYITDGVTDLLVPRDYIIPKGWKRGSTNKPKIDPQSTKGMMWVTNGVDNKLIRGDIPEGYYRGRVVSKV